jgi:hypothetical protein
MLVVGCWYVLLFMYLLCIGSLWWQWSSRFFSEGFFPLYLLVISLQVVDCLCLVWDMRWIIKIDKLKYLGIHRTERTEREQSIRWNPWRRPIESTLKVWKVRNDLVVHEAEATQHIPFHYSKEKFLSENIIKFIYQLPCASIESSFSLLPTSTHKLHHLHNPQLINRFHLKLILHFLKVSSALFLQNWIKIEL